MSESATALSYNFLDPPTAPPSPAELPIITTDARPSSLSLGAAVSKPSALLQLPSSNSYLVET